MPTTKTVLAKALKGVKKSKKSEPLWAGPSDSGPQGGITQSLLSRFLVCRERFRLLVVEGLKPNEGFNHRLEYGNMWHLCEEKFAADYKSKDERTCEWSESLREYCQKLAAKHKTEQFQVDKWYRVCNVQFPIYIKYWEKNADVKARTPLLQEEAFNVPYELPSGRTAYLRGKWDSVDLIGKGKNAGIYLQENKTKGEIKEEQLQRQLMFDIQTGIYLVALDSWLVANREPGHYSLRGVRYNVIRRPLSGGKGNIRQKKPCKKYPQGQSLNEYYNELGAIIEEEPEYFFMRWKVEVTPTDLERFKHEFLNPILESLCDWWDWISRMGDDPFGQYQETSAAGGAIHWRHPFGVYNSLNEGRASDMDEYLVSGNEAGLYRTDELFPELVEE